MQYVVRHLTRFVYTTPVCESVMELRMQPLERDGQQCLRFAVSTMPRARVFAYRDHYGNAVHYFDVPGHHAKLDVTVESVVSMAERRLSDEPSSDPWMAVDRLSEDAEFDDWLAPSRFTTSTDALAEFARAIGLDRTEGPLVMLRRLTQAISEQFAYEPRSTRVDSPIDEALRARAGVCQDFTHIMIALLRELRLPARYVSGYIAPRHAKPDRSADNATHAWVEAFVPGSGWVGCDPTNNILADARHIAVAVGRDYADVPPTRGVFKGDAGSELSVAVAVSPTDRPVEVRELSPTVSWITPPRATPDDVDLHAQRHQQQ
jgi:transglutaminase-like putative cysteine protease